MRRLVKLTALVLVMAAMAAMLLGCDSLLKSDEEKIADRLQEFITACNSGDLDGALDCLDKSSRKTYGAVFNIGNGIFGGLTGFEIDVRDLMAVTMGMTGSDFFTLQIQSISLTSKKEAVATVSLSFTNPQTGETQTEGNMRLPMIKEGLDWYIDARIDWYKLMEEMS